MLLTVLYFRQKAKIITIFTVNAKIDLSLLF